MLLNFMKKASLLGLVALAASACLNTNGMRNQYEINIMVRYEPEYYYDQESFLNEFFNGGADTVAVNEYLTYGPVTHYSKLDGDGELVGGFAMCTGHDTGAAPDRKPSRFAVYDKGGADESLAYVVFHDTTSALMPEHALRFAVPNEESSSTMHYVYVQNVQAAVQAAIYGNDLEDGPFGAGDYLALSITGIKGTNTTGNVSVKLIDGTTPLDKWTEVDLSSLGSIDALDLRLEASRPDFPLYCCLDNLYFHYIEIY